MAQDKLQLIFDIINGKDTLNPALDKSKKNTTKLDKGLIGVSKTAKAMGSSFVKFGGILAGVAASAAAIFGGFSLVKMVEEAKKGEDAINSLNSALQNTGLYTPEVSKSLADFSSELQKVSRFGDDTLQTTMALIQNLGNLDEKGLKRATKATIDLATALRIDLKAAATLVGKAAAGEVSSFTRYGVVIRKAGTNAETFANALDALEKKFGGSAERDIRTYSGAVAQASNNFGDFLEEIGKAITKNPVVIDLINKMSTAFAGLTSKIAENLPAITKGFKSVIIGTINFGATTLKVFADIEKALQPFVQTFYALIQTVVTGWGELGKAIADTGIIQGGIRSISTLIGTAIFGIKELFDLIISIPGAASAFKTAGVDISGVSEKLGSAAIAVDEFGDSIASSDISGGIDSITSGIDGMFKTLSDGQKNASEKLNSTSESLKKLSEELEKVKNKEVKLTVTRDVQEKVSISAKIGKELEDMLKKSAGSFVSALGQGEKGAKSALKTVATSVGSAFGPIAGQMAGPLIELLSMGKEEMTQAVKAFTAALPELIENIITNLPILIQALVDGLVDALFVLVERIDDIVKEFILSFIRAVPRIITKLQSLLPGLVLTFTTEMIKAIPSMMEEFSKEMLKIPEQFVKALIDELGGLGGGVIGESTNIVSDIVGTVGSVFKFAKGGIPEIKSVPSGFMNDTFPAALTSGEMVVDRDTTGDLKQFLDNGSEETNSLLLAILNKLGDGQVVNTSVQVNQKAFADIMLEINRNNLRTV
jgi:flagellar biosynthesis protein FliQ